MYACVDILIIVSVFVFLSLILHSSTIFLNGKMLYTRVLAPVVENCDWLQSLETKNSTLLLAFICLFLFSFSCSLFWKWISFPQHGTREFEFLVMSLVRVIG